jgi:hypothetical protein
MCYSPDGGNRNQGGTSLDCADHLHFDCGHDDYFDTEPEAGEYLASHWNLGSPLNRFLAFGEAGPNGPPEPVNDLATVEKDFARDLFVLANDSDPDGDDLRLTSVGDPPHGRASVAPGGGSIRYAPDLGFVGQDSFNYKVTDDSGTPVAATVTVTVRDTIAPAVTAVAPAAGATTALPGVIVSAKLSEPMTASTLTTGSVRLVRRGSGVSVPATVRYIAATRTAVLDPAGSLVPGGTYTATVTRAARDLSGNPLAAARSWTFQVRR